MTNTAWEGEGSSHLTLPHHNPSSKEFTAGAEAEAMGEGGHCLAQLALLNSSGPQWWPHPHWADHTTQTCQLASLIEKICFSYDFLLLPDKSRHVLS